MNGNSRVGLKLNHHSKNLNPAGIDIAWKNGLSGFCLLFRDRPFFWLFTPDELLSFNFPPGIYLVDAPLTLPTHPGRLRQVDKLLRKIAGISPLPVSPSILPDYLPAKLLKKRKQGIVFLESFVPFLRLRKLGKAKFHRIKEYRKRFKEIFGFPLSPPSPHLMDAYLLCLRAKELTDKSLGLTLIAKDGRIHL